MIENPDREFIRFIQDEDWDKFIILVENGTWDPNREIVVNFMSGETHRQPLLPVAIRKPGDNATVLALKLIQAGANPNIRSEGGTPLILACEVRNHEVIEALLNAGADVNAITGMSEDASYETSLMIAAGQSDLWTVERLLKAGADPNILTRHKKESPIYFAASGRWSNISDAIIRTLLSADCKLRGNELHNAVYHREIEMVKTLLECGCPTNEMSTHNEFDGPRKGETPLSLAAAMNTEDMASSILRREDAPQKKMEIVKMLLGANANPNLPNSRGETTLYLATRGETLSVAEMLFRAGADPHLARNPKFGSAFSLAGEKKLDAFLQLFNQTRT